MKIFRMLRLFAGFVILCGITPAAAQMDRQPVQLQPNQQAYQKEAQVFPKLPPSRACTARDMPGLWKLVLVYENPAGPDMKSFLTSPVQYLVFNANSTFGLFYAGNRPAAPNIVRNVINRQQAKKLQQYLVDASGFAYFYVNRQAVRTMACFIVATPQQPFSRGQMLLIPPQGQSKERLLKVYARVGERRYNPHR